MRKAAVLALFVCACSSCSVEEPIPMDENLPVRIGPANASAIQFMEVFETVCLDGFPQVETMRSTAKVHGYELTGQTETGVVGERIDVERYENDLLGLTLHFGTTSVLSHGGRDAGLSYWKTCRLRGYVSDPHNLSKAAVRETYQPKIELDDIKDRENWLGASWIKKGENVRATLKTSSSYVVESQSSVVGADLCGDLPRCRVWSEPMFELWIRLDD